MSTDAVSTPEYDAFGPWVYEVTTEEEVPPLFRGHPLDLASCRLVLKVPRDILRRDANPSMNLYDHLVVAGPDELTLLSRRQGGFDAATVGYDSVCAIENSVDLLDGRLTVHTKSAEKAIRFHYNSSSDDVVRHLVRVLRKAYLPAGSHGTTPPVGRTGAPLRPLRLGDLGDDDVALVTEQHNLRREEPTAVLLAAHPRRVVTPAVAGIPGVASRLTHAAWPMALQGALVCSDGREVQLIHRRQWFARGHRPVNSVATTVIPVDRVDQVSATEHTRYADVRVLTVRLGTTVLDIPVPAGSDAETVLLAALGQG